MFRLLPNCPSLATVAAWLTLVNTAVSAEPASPPDAIYILIGQSNMAGRAPLSPEDLTPIPSVLLLNDQGQWEPATNPLNRYASDRKALSMQRLGAGRRICPPDA